MRSPISLALLCIGLLLVVAPRPAEARPSGITTGGMGCNTEDGCHGPLSGNVEVLIEGPAVIEPGGTAIYSLSLEDVFPGFLAEACFADVCGAGLNVALQLDGEPYAFVPEDVIDENTRSTGAPEYPFLNEADGEITHLFDANLFGPGHNGGDAGSIGVYDYTFAVSAPEQEAVLTIFAAMNGFNGNGDETGDFWNRTSMVVTVPEPTAAPLGGAVLAALAALWAFRPARGVSRRS